MRSRRSAEHQEAVDRRLALLAPPDPGPPPVDPPPVGPPPGDPRPADTWGGPTRVRQRPAERWPDPDTLEEPDPLGLGLAVPVRVPVPGRHASRRTTRPPGPPAPVRLGLVHLAVLAVVVAMGLAVTSWWVVRSEPVPVSAPVPAAAPSAPDGSGSEQASLVDLPGNAATGEAAGVVVVDVAGRVRRPGVRELPAGSRVVDAIEAAGGARGGVDLSGLNLARVLVDGEQVLVGPGAPVAGAPGGAGGVAAAPGGPAALVNLNTADQATLESLPEVGPVTALAILSWREEHGGFTAVQELLEVDGIGPATLETLAPLVTV